MTLCSIQAPTTSAAQHHHHLDQQQDNDDDSMQQQHSNEVNLNSFDTIDLNPHHSQQHPHPEDVDAHSYLEKPEDHQLGVGSEIGTGVVEGGELGSPHQIAGGPLPSVGEVVDESNNKNRSKYIKAEANYERAAKKVEEIDQAIAALKAETVKLKIPYMSETERTYNTFLFGGLSSKHIKTLFEHHPKLKNFAPPGRRLVRTVKEDYKRLTETGSLDSST
eukprot:Awhi_evm1s2987